MKHCPLSVRTPRMLSSHKEEITEREGRYNTPSMQVPPDFVCRLSRKIMKDPVVLASGFTFERACIEAWIDNGNVHCPITRAPLWDLHLLPNLALKNLISSWVSSPEGPHSNVVPPGFICHISGKIMKDPVVLASGYTFERASTEVWLEAGNMHCPITRAPLKHLQLLPNLTLKNLISSWMSSHSDPNSHVSFSSSSSVDSDSFPSLSSSTHSYHRSFPSAAELPKLLREAGFSSRSFNLASDIGNDAQYMDESFLSTRSASDVSASRWEGCMPPYPVQERNNHGDMRRRSMVKEHLQQLRMDQPSQPSSYAISRINTLVTNLQSIHTEVQRNAAMELRLLAKNVDNNRMMIAHAGALAPLICLLQSTHESTQQESTTALLNLCLNEKIREEAIKEGAVEALIRVVKEGMSSVAMENAAAALTSLATGRENKARIGAAEAIPALLELLDNGSLRGKKDAATALYALTAIEENRRRLVRGGATLILVNLISSDDDDDDDDDNGKMVEKAIALVRNLVMLEEGRVAFVAEGGIESLFRILQVGSMRSKVLSIGIFYQLCHNSSKHRSLILQKEPMALLMDLSSSALATARVKAEIAELVRVLMKPAKR